MRAEVLLLVPAPAAVARLRHHSNRHAGISPKLFVQCLHLLQPLHLAVQSFNLLHQLVLGGPAVYVDPLQVLWQLHALEEGHIYGLILKHLLLRDDSDNAASGHMLVLKLPLQRVLLVSRLIVSHQQRLKLVVLSLLAQVLPVRQIVFIFVVGPPFVILPPELLIDILLRLFALLCIDELPLERIFQFMFRDHLAILVFCRFFLLCDADCTFLCERVFIQVAKLDPSGRPF